MVHVLVIEDNPMLLSLTQDLLTAAGFEVDVAASGEEGRKKIKNNLPDLLVLDLTLPDDFGLDICREMKKSYPSLLIFIMTALGNAEDVEAGKGTGAGDYIPKPFKIRGVTRRVKNTLR